MAIIRNDLKSECGVTAYTADIARRHRTRTSGADSNDIGDSLKISGNNMVFSHRRDIRPQGIINRIDEVGAIHTVQIEVGEAVAVVRHNPQACSAAASHICGTGHRTVLTGQHIHY